MQALEPVAQHGAVGLAPDVGPHLDPVVGPDADEVPVEGRVVQLAQGEPVVDHGLAAGLPVRDDVGGVEQLLVAQPAEAALAAVRRAAPAAGSPC